MDSAHPTSQPTSCLNSWASPPFFLYGRTSDAINSASLVRMCEALHPKGSQKDSDCVLQRDFTVRVQSATPLSISDVTASNGDVSSVTPVSGSSGSYDVAVVAKKSGVVAVSTAAAASTISVDVDTEEPKVGCDGIIGTYSMLLFLL